MTGTELLTTRTLEELERAVHRGLETFVDVGLALLEIRDRRLYRERGFDRFEDYCRVQFEFSRIHAHRLIKAAEVATMLPMGNIPNERQARELTPLLEEPEELNEAWNEVITEFGDSPTAQNIRDVVQRREEQRNPLAVHFSSDSNEWYTPTEIVNRVVRTLGTIDLDPCSNSLETPNVPAARHYTSNENGLIQLWFGSIYMNPPYGRAIDAWVKKLCDEYSEGRTIEAIALVPSRTDTDWFRRLRDQAICFIDGRLKFSGMQSGAPFPSAAVYFGTNRERFNDEFGDIGDIWVRYKAYE